MSLLPVWLALAFSVAPAVAAPVGWSHYLSYAPPHQVVLPAQSVRVSAAGVRVCPPPARYVADVGCSSGVPRTPFFFPEKAAQATADVHDMPLEAFLGERHYRPTVRSWWSYSVTLEDGHKFVVVMYQP